MKKFLSIILAGAMVLSLTACNGTTSESVDTGSTPTDDAISSVTEDTSNAPADDTSAPAEDNAPIEEIPYQLGGELTPTMIANSVLNKGNQARLAKVFKKLQAGEEVTVAYLGGSITQGSSAGNTLCYARLTTDWLEEKFPDAKINYVNAGIGATGSYIGIHRTDRDVLAHDPDLVFIDFSVNDTSDRMKINSATYEGLIRKLWQYETSPAIVTIAMTQDNGTSVQTEHSEIAIKYDIPMISYRNAILDVIDKGYIKWTDISDDNIHPNVPGHAVLSQMITNYLQTVIDNIDSIDTTDPALPGTSDSGMKYQNATVVLPDDARCTATGVFMKHTGDFGNFGIPWMARVNGGEEVSGGLEFTVEAQNIGILYGKLVSKAGILDIYVDDELMMSINCSFPGGWGNYVEFQEVATFMTASEHTVKIVPQNIDTSAAYYISGLAIS